MESKGFFLFPTSFPKPESFGIPLALGLPPLIDLSCIAYETNPLALAKAIECDARHSARLVRHRSFFFLE